MFYIICTALKWYIFAHAIDVEIVYLEGRQRKSVLGKDIWSLKGLSRMSLNIPVLHCHLSQQPHFVLLQLAPKVSLSEGSNSLFKTRGFFQKGSLWKHYCMHVLLSSNLFWIMDKGIAKAFHMVWQNLKEMGKVFMEWWIKMQKIGSKTTTIYCVATKIMLGA